MRHYEDGTSGAALISYDSFFYLGNNPKPVRSVSGFDYSGFQNLYEAHYTYTSYGDYDTITYRSFDFDANSWTEPTRFRYLYNQNHNAAQIAYDTSAGGLWGLNKEVTYFYYLDSALSVTGPPRAKAAIRISPNPAANEITCSIGGHTGGEFVATDISGKIVATGNVPNNSTSTKLPVSSLLPGLYVFTYWSAAAEGSAAFVKE